MIFSTISARADDTCDEPKTKYGTNGCAAADFKQADKQLNDVYNRAIKKLKTPSSGKFSQEDQKANDLIILKLRDGERSWVSYGDSWCAYYASYGDGRSMQPLFFDTCRTKLNTWNI